MNNKPIGYIGLALVLLFCLRIVVMMNFVAVSWLDGNIAAWGAFACCVVGFIFGVIGWKTTPGKVAACMGGIILLGAFLDFVFLRHART